MLQTKYKIMWVCYRLCQIKGKLWYSCIEYSSILLFFLFHFSRPNYGWVIKECHSKTIAYHCKLISKQYIIILIIIFISEPKRSHLLIYQFRIGMRMDCYNTIYFILFYLVWCNFTSSNEFYINPKLWPRLLDKYRPTFPA